MITQQYVSQMWDAADVYGALVYPGKEMPDLTGKAKHLYEISRAPRAEKLCRACIAFRTPGNDLFPGHFPDGRACRWW